MNGQTQLDSYVNQLKGLVKQHILPQYQWYWTHKTLPRVCFRGAGVLVVIGSLVLPVIAAAKGWNHRESALTTVSLAVAILSSLSTFFKWDTVWQSRTKAAMELKSLLAQWELALSSLGTAENPSKSALCATQKLFEDAFRVIGSETTGFFATVKWPETPKTE